MIFNCAVGYDLNEDSALSPSLPQLLQLKLQPHDLLDRVLHTLNLLTHLCNLLL